MKNYIINLEKSKHFWLTFSANGKGIEWQDYDLPTPHYLHHNHTNYSYIIAWAIVGYFGTVASKEFLLDVVARFCLALEADRLPWKPEIRDSGHIYNREAIELKTLSANLPSLPWDHGDTQLADFVDKGIRRFNRNSKKQMQSEDALFEATRWHLYRRAYAENTTINITEDYVQILLETENQLLSNPKSTSDIKSKARRMSEYMQNEFVIYTDIKGYAEWSKEQRAEYMRVYRKLRRSKNMATRTEHMAKVNANRKRKTQARIRDLVEDLFARERIRFKNGKLRIGVIAKELNLTPETVSAHLKEMDLK